MTVWVAHFSPAGTTRQVAEIIAKEAERAGQAVTLKDLTSGEADAGPILENFSPGDVLFVGSPVYAGQPVPPVMEFLSGLPDAPGTFAAPFVTYGGVNSGRALYDMAKMMGSRNLKVLGGIKVLAVHSLMWQSVDPVAKGHPNTEDAAEVQEFVRMVLEKKESPEPKALRVESLDYNGQATADPAGKSKLEALKSNVLPMELDTEACTQCGACADSCPTRNIILSPYPVFGNRCILCFNCVRNCEENAVGNQAVPGLESLVRKRKESFKEPEETRVFV